MSATSLPLDDLGAYFEQRWRRASLSAKRQILAELRDIYSFLEEEDIPLLAPHPVAPSIRPTIQENLWADAAPSQAAPLSPSKNNPFLPQHIRDRLHGNVAAHILHPPSPPPITTTPMTTPTITTTLSFEKTLYQQLGTTLERFQSTPLETVKKTLRQQLHEELDKLLDDLGGLRK